MESRNPHIADDRILQFAEGDVILDPREIIHFQDCDECSTTWWLAKQRAKAKKVTDEKRKDKSA